MKDAAEELNCDIREGAPAVWRLLSSLGRRAIYPPDITFQAAQARGARYNASIGQITNGAGAVLPVPSLHDQLGGLRGDRDAALLYSPIEGMPEMRRLWRERQRRAIEKTPSTLPVVVAGLTHGLSLIADLFCEEGRTVVAQSPCWGNYRQIFSLRRGAKVVAAEVFASGAFDAAAIRDRLAEIPPGDPAVVILNLPSNPVGYSLRVDERHALVEILLVAASARPLLVVCDDAYAGLVYEEGIPTASLFWELAGRHPNLVPVKVDGVTKELVFFGGRVAFVTFAFAPDSPVALALESKFKCLLRASIGSLPSLSQVAITSALEAPELDAETDAVRAVLESRYRVLRAALDQVRSDLVRPLPFNSGCFALLPLADGLDPETVRVHLLEEHDTGVIAIAPNYIRLAYCSLAEEAIPETVRRVAAGLEECFSS